MKKEEFNPKPFKIPDNFFDKLYEFTGREEASRGFICIYNTNGNCPTVYSRFSNPMVEMALVKASELFAKERNDGFSRGLADSEDAEVD